jgi:polyhydroxybutyrate depolymerase
LRFDLGGVQRRAVLVNEGSHENPRPVVLVLHGGGGSAEDQRRLTGFDAVAVAEGFAVVYAEGTAWAEGRHAWNTGHLLRGNVGGADDIGYFDMLIDRLVRDHHADPARVYMTGGSNGAMMTYVYGVTRPGKLAAIAPVVGAMFSFDTRPAVPLPILMINGRRDEEVPIDGGWSRNRLVRRAQGAPFRSHEDTVAFWVSVNRSRRPGIVATEGTVTTTTYPATEGGAETVSVVDAAGGHGWPGAETKRRDNVPIKAFDGAERVWAFFRTHRRGM